MRARLQRFTQPDGFSADLAFVVGFTVLSALVFLVPPTRETPLRYVFGAPLLLVFPGYALVSALFPENGTTTASDVPEADAEDGGTFLRHDVDGIERLALSVGTSVVLVALLTFLLDQSGVGVGAVSVVLRIGVVTTALALVAVVRRRQLPPSERFSVPVRRYLAATRAELLDPETNADAALNVLVLAFLVATVVAVGYGAAVASQPAADTTFSLVTENESGRLVASGYPSSPSELAETALYVGIDNNEGKVINYTIVVVRQEIRRVNDSSQVVDEGELARFERRVEPGNSTLIDHRFLRFQVGNATRITYLLYRGPPPENPDVTNAYRDLYLWLDDGSEEEARTTASPTGRG